MPDCEEMSDGGFRSMSSEGVVTLSYIDRTILQYPNGKIVTMFRPDYSGVDTSTSVSISGEFTPSIAPLTAKCGGCAKKLG